METMLRATSYMYRTGQRVARGLLVALCSVLGQAYLSIDAHAQDLDSNSVHWAYSSYFGTGWYEIRDNRDVYVLRVAPRWRLRESGFTTAGERTVGVDLKLAITAGLDSLALSDLPDAIALDNFASLSVSPGIDITIPVTELWTIRPYASLGWGRLLSENQSAWTYWAGIKSRYTFSHGNLDWALINTLGYVDYTPSQGPSEDFWPLMTGLEFDYPFANFKLDGEQLFVSWHGTYTVLENDLDLTIVRGSLAPISDQWEVGFALHKETSPIRAGWFKIDRLGLAYRFSSSGNLKGIGLVLRSAFDR